MGERLPPRLPLALMAATWAALAAACAQARDVPRVVVAVTPEAARVPAGSALQLAARVSGAGRVAWWVREPAGCGHVTQDGVWTAPPVPPRPPLCHVVATSHEGARSAAAAVEVQEGPRPGWAIRETRLAGGRRQFAVAPPGAAAWAVEEGEADATDSRPEFPLRISAGGRYLEDQAGRPFRIQADAAWFMSTNATPEEVELYLALRQAQGFNAFYLMAMVHPGSYTGVPTAPANRAGVAPFAVPGSFATPSEPYWRWIDFIVDRAAARGMVVMFAYTYLGYEGAAQGWYQEVLAQPDREACHEWGRWLGRRYRAKDNLVWFALGDYHPPAGSEGSIRVRRIVDGIKAAGAGQLFMAEMSPPDTLPSDVRDFADVIDLESFYGYGPRANGLVYETADRAFAKTPARPAWQQEGIYELDSNVPAFTGAPWETRRARFWSVLAGGLAGDGFGSRDAYRWASVPASLFTPGAEYSRIAFRFFEALPWWTLRPSRAWKAERGRELIVAGGGTWGASDAITAAASTAGTHLVAYVPPTGAGARTFSVDLTVLRGPARARWLDPATGDWKPMEAEVPNDGPRAFTTPGGNGSGLDDWVLLLDAPGADRRRCGSITASGLYTPPANGMADPRCRVRATVPARGSLVEPLSPAR